MAGAGSRMAVYAGAECANGARDYGQALAWAAW